MGRDQTPVERLQQAMRALPALPEGWSEPIEGDVPGEADVRDWVDFRRPDGRYADLGEVLKACESGEQREWVIQRYRDKMSALISQVKLEVSDGDDWRVAEADTPAARALSLAAESLLDAIEKLTA